MIDLQYTLELLSGLKSDFEEEIFFRRQTRSFVERSPDFWSRSRYEGHVTGSAWVLHPDGERVLMIHHRKLDKWLQPGGHAEDSDENLADTARRETEEECGVDRLNLVTEAIFDLDIHVIPAKNSFPEHLHYDFRFLFQAESDALVGDKAEIKDLCWVPVDELIGRSYTQQSIRRMALKSRKMQL